MTRIQRRIVFTIFLCVFLAACASRTPIQVDWVNSRYAEIDRHALSVKGRLTRDVERLARELTRPARNDEEKARAIYRWMAENIDYDTKAYFAGNSNASPHEPADVLKARRAVCEGYARTFVALAAAAGLEAAYIRGHTRSSLTERSQEGDDANHAWNAVRVNGQWHLLDVTWAAGTVDNTSLRFTRRLDDHWFLTPPEHMIKSHYPDSRGWQLLSHPFSFASFFDQPHFWTSFFHHGLQLRSHHRSFIRLDGETTIVLRSPEHVSLIAWLENSGRRLPDSHIRTVSTNGQHTIRVSPPQTGDYLLTVLDGDLRQSRIHYAALQYHLIVIQRPL